MYLGVFKSFPNIRGVFAHAGDALPHVGSCMSLGAFNEIVAGNVPDSPPA